MNGAPVFSSHIAIVFLREGEKERERERERERRKAEADVRLMPQKCRQAHTKKNEDEELIDDIQSSAPPPLNKPTVLFFTLTKDL